jgi:serpin B
LESLKTNIMKSYISRITLLFVASLLVFGSCSRKSQKAMDQQITDENVRNILNAPLPERNLHFAFDLLKALPEYEENFVISPFSISTALSMTYAGAREETQRQMVETLYFWLEQEAHHQEFSRYLTRLQEMAGDQVQLNIANSIWAQHDYNFLQSFFDVLETHYGSLLKEVDFLADREAIRRAINDWVEEETRDKIRDLIAPGVLTDDTRMVLVNAIHFFGPWDVEFDKDLTRPDRFTTLDGTHITTDFMYRSERLPYFEDEMLQVLEIPYADETFSMVIMLPKTGYRLPDMEQQLNAERYLEIINQLEAPTVDLDILIPKFKARTKTDMEDLLAEMGMPLAFSDHADFSGMTGMKDLKIDKVIHEAMIEVAEEGTEAAAATAVVIIRKTSIDPDPRILFRADRPFLYFIKDNRFNSVLFMGRTNSPE